MAKVTLQEIASLAGVTAATVHKALSNNKGVSDSKRKEIIEIAEHLNYAPYSNQFNKHKIIATLFPEPVGEDKYFYQYIWAGIAAREDELKSSDCKVIKISFDGTIEDQLDKMETILKIYGNSIHGLMTIIWEESRFLNIIERFDQLGIKVFTISADAPYSCRAFTLMANAYRTGRLAAEYLGSILHDDFGRVMIIGTKRDAYNHSNMVRGFYDQMNISNPKIQVIEVYESKKYPERLEQTVHEFMTRFDDIKGIYTNNARTTVQIINALKKECLNRKIIFIGSEVFHETIEAMKDGTMQAIIDQNAYGQAYDGLSLAFKYLKNNKTKFKSVYQKTGQLYLNSNISPENDDLIEPNPHIVLNKEFNTQLKRYQLSHVEDTTKTDS